MDGRRSAIFLLVVGLGLAAVALAFLHAHRERARAAEGLAAMRALVEAFDLTDPALFTEARYTRHPSVADRHSAFQDAPLSPEHFPSGALVPPPARLRASDLLRRQESGVRGQGEPPSAETDHGPSTMDHQNAASGPVPLSSAPGVTPHPSPLTLRAVPLLTVSHEGDAP